jgi:hypothetical protein
MQILSGEVIERAGCRSSSTTWSASATLTPPRDSTARSVRWHSEDRVIRHGKHTIVFAWVTGCLKQDNRRETAVVTSTLLNRYRPSSPGPPAIHAARVFAIRCRRPGNVFTGPAGR